MKLLFEFEEQAKPSEIRAEQERREELHKIYYRIFSSNDGKMILEDLASASGMYRTNFVQNNSDYTSFMEGHRALFLYICAQIETQTRNMEGNL